METFTSTVVPCYLVVIRIIDLNIAMVPSQYWKTVAIQLEGLGLKVLILILCLQRCRTIAMEVIYKNLLPVPATFMDKLGLLLLKDLNIHKGTGDILAHLLSEVEAEDCHTKLLFFSPFPLALRHVICILEKLFNCDFKQQSNRLE
uniref:Uncharacterized protein n=2 Tax=Micrurus TaxID=8634 RepID=A0A2D4KW91_9SAUR